MSLTIPAREPDGVLVPPNRHTAPPAPPFSWRSDRAGLSVLGVGVFVAVLLVPFISASPYLISILTSAMIYVMLALGLNVVVGYAGLLDLGYIAFFAVGAYTSGILTTKFGFTMVAAIPVTIAACILAGIVIGGPTLRLRSDYLAIVTPVSYTHLTLPTSDLV